MLVGVADDKKGNEVIGVADWKALLETIPNLMRDTMGMIADVNHLKMKGKDVVEIVVPAYPVPISLRGVYYVRARRISDFQDRGWRRSCFGEGDFIGRTCPARVSR